MRRRLVHVVFGLALLCGCGGEDPLTEIVVAVDTDMRVPEELDAVRIDVVGPAGELRRSTGSLGGPGDLPALLGIAHRGGPTGPVRITVTGRLEGADVVQRRAVVDFVPERVVVLRLWLERACIGVRCGEDQTCAGGSCRSQRVRPGELEDWDGEVERLDGGAGAHDGGPSDGGDGCVPAAEECNELDDDCDGEIDEVFDRMRDPSHCGACGNECPADPANAAGVCVEGECTLLCDPGWADCGGTDDGCESSLSSIGTCGACDVSCGGDTPFCADTGGSTHECVAACGSDRVECSGSCVDTDSSPQHCGECDNLCPARPHAVTACAAGTCGYLCDSGWRDCDGAPDNGCESRLRELTSCGACGVACEPPHAVATCTTGTCEIVSCEGTYADCNGSIVDGCETDTSTNAASCGRCGNTCPADPPNATASCRDGGCTLDCEPGFANCNGDLIDGCEASLASTETCGSCGIRCDGSTPVCATGTGSWACAADCGTGTLCSGSCVDTGTSPLHCGGCGDACPERPRSTRACDSGACTFHCDTGWEDCNDMPGDGCEARLGSVSHCGGCDVRCTLANATPSCVEDACVIASCAEGWADCDGADSTGCEADLATDASHCGECGNECASGSCTGGTCDAVPPDGGVDAGPADGG